MAELIKNELKDTDKLVAIGLVFILGLSLFYGSNELSMSIASGLIGFLGRSKMKE